MTDHRPGDRASGRCRCDRRWACQDPGGGPQVPAPCGAHPRDRARPRNPPGGDSDRAGWVLGDRDRPGGSGLTPRICRDPGFGLSQVSCREVSRITRRRTTASANRRAPGRRTGNARLSSLRTPLFHSTTAPAGIDTASSLGPADGRDYRQWYIPALTNQRTSRTRQTSPGQIGRWTCTRWFGSRVTATA